jgi:hypothetical protein
MPDQTESADRITPLERPVRVTDLVSSYAPDNSELAAGLVRSAKVAWTMFYNEAGQQTVQVGTLLASKISSGPDVVRFLSEAYARAIFETAFAMYFDKADPMLDIAVLRLIEEAYGLPIRIKVYATVAERGILLCSPNWGTEGAIGAWRLSPRRLSLALTLEGARADAAAFGTAQPTAEASTSKSRFPSLLRRLSRYL